VLQNVRVSWIIRWATRGEEKKQIRTTIKFIVAWNDRCFSLHSHIDTMLFYHFFPAYFSLLWYYLWTSYNGHNFNFQLVYSFSFTHSHMMMIEALYTLVIRTLESFSYWRIMLRKKNSWTSKRKRRVSGFNRKKIYTAERVSVNTHSHYDVDKLVYRWRNQWISA
jgi:hypothetical protein